MSDADDDYTEPNSTSTGFHFKKGGFGTWDQEI